jgi:type II secretory pathway pseudopilin PulG
MCDTLATFTLLASGAAFGIVGTLAAGVLADYRARKARARKARAKAAAEAAKAAAEAAKAVAAKAAAEAAKAAAKAAAEAAKAAAERKARVRPVVQPARGRQVWQGDTWA